MGAGGGDRGPRPAEEEGRPPPPAPPPTPPHPAPPGRPGRAGGTPAPEPPPDDPSSRPLRPSEIELVYSDPRGIRLYKSKVDDRWIVSQIDPRVGQPVTYELPGSEGERIKMQLAGSPYWLKEV